MATDPRAENCRGFKVENNKVTGVHLDVLPVPQGRFELRSVTLIDEASAGGNIVATVTVLDKDGVLAEAPVYLAWPWEGALPMANKLLPGNANRPAQHMITNGYDAAGGQKGPLAIYVGDNKGLADSDVCGGLGLPNNRHVCFALVYKERGAVTPPPDPDPEPDPEPEPGDGSIVSELRLLRAVVERLADHLGA